MLHVGNSYLHFPLFMWPCFIFHVGKYTIHGIPWGNTKLHLRKFPSFWLAPLSWSCFFGFICGSPTSPKASASPKQQLLQPPQLPVVSKTCWALQLASSLVLVATYAETFATTFGSTTWMSGARKLGWMVTKWGEVPPIYMSIYKYVGEITQWSNKIDPKFLGHPSTKIYTLKGCGYVADAQGFQGSSII